jgi:hypothetical protein
LGNVVKYRFSVSEGTIYNNNPIERRIWDAKITTVKVSKPMETNERRTME